MLMELSTRIITEHLHQGGGVLRNFPLPSALQINLQGDGLHVQDEYDMSS